NVEQQRRDPHSLLNSVERMIRLRKEHPEFGFGNSAVVDSAEPAVFAIRATWEDDTTFAVHNLSDRPGATRVPLQDNEATYVLDSLTGDRFEPRRDGTVDVELEPFAYRWLRPRHGPVEPAQTQTKRSRAQRAESAAVS